MLEDRKRGVEEVVDLPEVRRAVDQDLVAVDPHDRLLRLVGLVDDLAHQLLEDVLERDESVDASVLVDDDPEVDAPGP